MTYSTVHADNRFSAEATFQQTLLRLLNDPDYSFAALTAELLVLGTTRSSRPRVEFSGSVLEVDEAGAPIGLVDTIRIYESASAETASITHSFLSNRIETVVALATGVAGPPFDRFSHPTFYQTLDGAAFNTGTILGSRSNDILEPYSNNGTATLIGGAGDDTFVFAPGTAIGGAGTDVLDMSAVTGRAGVDFAAGRAVSSSGVEMFVSEIEGVIGGTGDDRMLGGRKSDRFEGGGGNDTMDGGRGSDLLFGGQGEDSMMGGGGGDRLVGDDDSDFLQGRDGNDTLLGGRGNDRLLGNAGADVLEGGPGNDELFGGGQNDTMAGGAGEDFLYGENGSDSLDGGAGGDSLNGGDGADTLVGASGPDTLLGGESDDMLFGGRGRDRLIAGDGNDTLSGGALGDTFSFSARTSGSKVILDYRPGADVIELAGFAPEDVSVERDGRDTIIRAFGRDALTVIEVENAGVELSDLNIF